jgi:hypothetical protein
MSRCVVAASNRARKRTKLENTVRRFGIEADERLRNGQAEPPGNVAYRANCGREGRGQNAGKRTQCGCTAAHSSSPAPSRSYLRSPRRTSARSRVPGPHLPGKQRPRAGVQRFIAAARGKRQRHIKKVRVRWRGRRRDDSSRNARNHRANRSARHASGQRPSDESGEYPSDLRRGSLTFSVSPA